MNTEQAKDLIRRIANQRCIGFSKHCSKRMGERNVNSDDFLHVLMWGKVIETVYDQKSEQWKCKIVGVDVDGESLTLVVAIYEEEQKLICVTVFD